MPAGVAFSSGLGNDFTCDVDDNLQRTVGFDFGGRGNSVRSIVKRLRLAKIASTSRIALGERRGVRRKPYA